jgi:serine/threonine protein kinase
MTTVEQIIQPVEVVQTENLTSLKQVSDEKPKRKIGKYIMLETLGEGGFSKVKLGISEETGEKVALKILKKNKLNLSSSTRRQVEREITAMGKIQHPNVIRLVDVDWDATYVKRSGKNADVILVVLELATGGELFEFLSFTGCFEEAVARTYFHQLIAGVGYCHSKGVVHRDLKPENLLLDGNFVLKLADFGFSNVFGASDKTMFTECGTPGYMAPEMIKNAGYEPTGADIWACGVILFIMLAGFPPFQKPNVSDWWFQKLFSGKHHLFWQAHSRNAYFSETTKDFINKILQPDPTKRITVADIKKHAWFNGPTISNTALVAELTRRKNEVDQAKFRERQEKKQRLQAGNAGNSDLNKVDVRAGEDDVLYDMEGIPVVPPSMGYGVPADKDQTGEMSGMGEEMGQLTLSSDNFGGEMSFGSQEEVKEKKLPAAPKFDATANPACYTRFESASAPGAVLDRVVATLDKMGWKSSVEESMYKIKAKILTKEGILTMAVQVFSAPGSSPSSAPISVVEFRRRNGDSIQFRNLYADIRGVLNDLVIQPKSSESSTKAAPVKADVNVNVQSNKVIATA